LLPTPRGRRLLAAVLLLDVVDDEVYQAGARVDPATLVAYARTAT
jgi:hypothetical protein